MRFLALVLAAGLLLTPTLATAACSPFVATCLAGLQRDGGSPGDAGEDPATAVTLPGHGTYPGRLEYPFDYYDWYEVYLAAGEDASFALAAAHGPRLSLYDAGGNLVDESDNSFSEDPAQPVTGTSPTPVRIDFTAPAAGTWYVEVRIYDARSVAEPLGEYALTWSSIPTPTPPAADPVVVATFDSGTNPFHPCFQGGTADARLTVPGYPSTSVPLDLTVSSTYAASLAASATELASITAGTLYHVTGTPLSYYAAPGTDQVRFIDDYGHGAQASSQIVCADYGMGTNAHVVVLDGMHTDAAGATTYGYEFEAQVRWAVQQDWIDVIHLNIAENLPFFGSWHPAVEAAVAAGKFVVVAGGNGAMNLGASYPTELSSFSGPPGTLVAGANDERGWALFSNLDPHVVMDGGDTQAAAADSFGTASYGGTSSASPRTTGYVANLLGQLRAQFGHTGNGLLTIPGSSTTSGPLSDGVLTAAELHEVVRKTADPDLHASRWDGSTSIWWTPAVPGPAGYAKHGYGEVSEHTLPDAVAVAAGTAPMPDRPVEDALYEASEVQRRTHYPPGDCSVGVVTCMLGFHNDAGQDGDAGDDQARARPIEPGTYEGILEYPWDYDDWYAVEVGPGTLTAQLDASYGAAVNIHDASGTLVATSGAVYGTGTAAATVGTAGTWYIVVTHYALESPASMLEEYTLTW